MKKAFLNRLLIGFSASATMVYGTILACGGGDWDFGWVYETNFTPETFVDPSYSKYFLSQDFFYGNQPMPEYSQFDGDIVADWAKFLDGKMKTEHVRFFLLDSSTADVNALYAYSKTKKTSVITEKWSKDFKLKDKDVQEFFRFLYYAKQIETASVNTGGWSYEPVQYKTFGDTKTLTEINNIYNSTQNKFLKNRWWFQTVKAYFYSNDKQKAIGFFQETHTTVPKDILYYRALSYVAGAHYKARNYAESNYYYSRVFNECPPLRDVAVFCFHPQQESDWRQSLAMTANNDEKVALWAIQGYYGDEEKAIEKIYEINPKSDYLDFLLTRLVNRQEVKTDVSFADKSAAENKKMLRDSLGSNAIKLVSRIAESANTSKPYLWNTAAGYLQTLDSHFEEAETFFAKAESQMPKTELSVAQLRLLRFVNKLSKLDRIDAKNETALVSDLQWIYLQLPNKEIPNFRYQNAASWSKNYLAALYKSQNNAVMSDLFSRKDNFYDDPKQLDAMKLFLSKNDKTAFETVAAEIYNVKLKDIYMYQAVRAAFANKIPEAIVLIEKTEDIQNQTFLGNPFNGNIKDCHDCDFQKMSKRAYSFKDFLLTISDMQNKVSKSEDIYTNSILLGNAFYNLSHYGNGRVFHEGNIFGYASSPFDFRDSSKTMATNCSVAKMYYSSALKAATDNEQRALCQYMLAKCERNEYYNQKYKSVTNWWEIYDDKVNFIAWSGFKALKNQYSKTEYYRDVIAECGYFRTYVSQQKK